MTADALKRLLLDALATGDDYDGFRTHLRDGLKAAEEKDAALERAEAALRADLRAISPRDLAASIVNKASQQ